MRTPLTILAIGLVTSLLGGPPAACQPQEQWQDLFTRDMRDWSRSGSGPSPWTLTSQGTLVCSPAHEIFVPEWEFGDGTLRVEYRFKADSRNKTVYRGAVLLRRTLDYSGCKVNLGENCGTVSAYVIASSDREKLVEVKAPPGLAKPAGEWNEIEFHLVGKTVSVYVNGKEGASFERCEVDRGLVALEAEGTEIEFRSVRWKEAGN
jgi:Domain of Unknown Function (DUF1080)